jgi:hypothetical protein
MAQLEFDIPLAQIREVERVVVPTSLNADFFPDDAIGLHIQRGFVIVETEACQMVGSCRGFSKDKSPPGPHKRTPTVRFNPVKSAERNQLLKDCIVGTLGNVNLRDSSLVYHLHRQRKKSIVVFNH